LKGWTWLGVFHGDVGGVGDVRAVLRDGRGRSTIGSTEDGRDSVHPKNGATNCTLRI
jgi:hypothetical protein